MANFPQRLLQTPPIRNALWRIATNSDVFHFLPTKLATYIADTVIDDPIDKAAYCMLANNTTTACQHLSSDKLLEIAAWLPIQLRASAYVALAERKVSVPPLTAKEQALLKKYRKPPAQAVDEHVTVDFLTVILKAKTDDAERKKLLGTMTTVTLRELARKLTDSSLQFCLGEIFLERAKLGEIFVEPTNKGETVYDVAYTCFLRCDHKDPKVEQNCKEILKRQLQYIYQDCTHKKLSSLANKVDNFASPSNFKPQHLAALRLLYEELYKDYKENGQYKLDRPESDPLEFKKLLKKNSEELILIHLQGWLLQRVAQGKDSEVTLIDIKSTFKRLGLNFDEALTSPLIAKPFGKKDEKISLLNLLDEKLKFAITQTEYSPRDAEFYKAIYIELGLEAYFPSKEKEIRTHMIIDLLGDNRHGRRQDSEQNLLSRAKLQQALETMQSPDDKLDALELAFEYIKAKPSLYTRQDNWRWLFFWSLRTDREVNQTFKDQMATLKTAYKQIVRQALRDADLSQSVKQAIIKRTKASTLIDFNTSYYERRRNMPTSSRLELKPLLDRTEQSMRLSR